MYMAVDRDNRSGQVELDHSYELVVLGWKDGSQSNIIASLTGTQSKNTALQNSELEPIKTGAG